MRQYRVTPKKAKQAKARSLGYSAWRERDEAARRAVHPAPPDLAPGAQWLHWPMVGIGWAADVRLLIPPDKGRSRPRSDQFTLKIDGSTVGERMGMTAIMRHLQAKVLVRQATREQRRESDLIAAQEWQC